MQLTLGWPQLIALIMIAFYLAIALTNDGKSRGEWSFPGALIDQLCWFGLLYWGGFFG